MNKTISRYLSKNILFPKQLDSMPEDPVGIIIVIPCYNEPKVEDSILAISSCLRPNCKVEVIVSVNAGSSDTNEIKRRNEKSIESIDALKSELPEWLNVFTLSHQDLNDKKAGVGLGRKIGMDEAVRRFVALEKERGIIVCFDADSSCAPNYLIEIESHFQDERISSASIHYAHPIEGQDFSEDIYESIIQYELHLRYFIQMQKKINLPFSFHTVGSSMACTVEAYCSVGGMNQRKAGEDFYFIHKLVKFGKHSELKTTKVLPSPRISDRVPFGTGRAIGEMQAQTNTVYLTYHPQSFYDLEKLVHVLSQVYKTGQFGQELPDIVLQYLDLCNGERELIRVKENTSDFDSFCKMFWHWFDAFQLMKYLHFARDKKYPNIPVLQAVSVMENNTYSSSKAALEVLRQKDLIIID